MEIYGEDGWAITEEAFGYDGTGEIRTSEGVFDFPVRNPYVGEVRDFVLAIEEGREPEVGGRRGCGTSTSCSVRSAPDVSVSGGASPGARGGILYTFANPD